MPILKQKIFRHALNDSEAPANSFTQQGFGSALSNVASFQNCYQGIFLKNSVPSTFFKIFNNRMTGMTQGLVTQHNESVGYSSTGPVLTPLIQNNRIACTDNGIHLTHVGGGKVKVNILDNNITLNYPAADPPNTTAGISLIGNATVSVTPDDVLVSQTGEDEITDILVMRGMNGVSVQNFRGANLRNHYIRMNAGNPTQSHGVWFSGGAGNTVEHTTVDGINKRYRGIQVENSMMNTFFSNHLLSNDIGFWVIGNCPSDIGCNHFVSNQKGMYYPNLALTGPQINRGNTWEFFPNGTLWGQNDNTNTTPSAYFTTNGALYCPPTNKIIPASNWFTCNYIDPPLCPTNESPAAALSGINQMERVFADTGYNLGVYTLPYNWTGQRMTYAHLDYDPGLINGDPVLETFYLNQQSQTIGQLQSVSEQTRLLYQLSTAQADSMDAYNAKIQTAVEQMVLVDSLMALNLNNSNYGTLSLQRIACHDTISKYTTLAEALYATYFQARQSSAANLVQTNAAISVNAAYQANEKTMMDIFLRTRARNYWPNPSERQSIKNIAEQCPLDGGQAVYWARAWHWEITGLWVEGHASCVGGRSEENPALVETAQDLSVFPNPATNYLTVHWQDSAENFTGQVRLFDVVGRLVLETQVSFQAEQAGVPLPTLPTGAYYLQVSVHGQATRVAKVLVAE